MRIRMRDSENHLSGYREENTRRRNIRKGNIVEEIIYCLKFAQYIILL